MSLKEFVLAVLLLISIIFIGAFFVAYPQLPWRSIGIVMALILGILAAHLSGELP
jgi:hypothetical protein